MADTSAWARAGHPAVASDWAMALAGGRILMTPIITLELLYSEPDAHRVEAREAELSTIRSLPLSQANARAATQALRDLARLEPGAHRVPPVDLLIAAAAQQAGAGVLHYDRHFDRLARVLGFESRWIAPAGSL